MTLEGAESRIWCSKIGWQTVPCSWSIDGEAALTGSSPGTRDQLQWLLVEVFEAMENVVDCSTVEASHFLTAQFHILAYKACSQYAAHVWGVRAYEVWELVFFLQYNGETISWRKRRTYLGKPIVFFRCTISKYKANPAVLSASYAVVTGQAYKHAINKARPW